MDPELFDLSIDSLELNDRISRQASELQRHRKVLDQYRLVFDQSLQAIEKRYRTKHSATKSQRLALVDAEHLSHIKNKLELKKACVEMKIAYESNRLLASARRSLNSYHQQVYRLKQAETNLRYC